jgi:tRNA modification GTPase
MLVEATLDFPEEDIDFLQKADATGQLQRLQTTLAGVLQCATQGAILREGIKVVIAGQPNAGKSSLLNALAGADVAIVTPVAGTTRDKVSQLIQIDGVPLHVVDTAGLRDTFDEVEKIGVARAWAEIESADAVVFLHELPRHTSKNHEIATHYIAEDAVIQRALAKILPKDTPVIHVWNKSDLMQGASVEVPLDGVLISAKSGDGLDALRRRLLATVNWQAMPDGIFMARDRHLVALRQVALQLETARAQMSAKHPALDLLAEDLRQAQRELGTITGAFSSDDLLGEIFSRFCIGK